MTKRSRYFRGHLCCACAQLRRRGFRFVHGGVDLGPESVSELPSYVLLVGLGVCMVVLQVVLKRVAGRSLRLNACLNYCYDDDGNDAYSIQYTYRRGSGRSIIMMTKGASSN